MGREIICPHCGEEAGYHEKMCLDEMVSGEYLHKECFCEMVRAMSDDRLVEALDPFVTTGGELLEEWRYDI